MADLRRIAVRLDALPPGMTFASALLSHEEISRNVLTGEARAARDGRDLFVRLSALPMLAGRAQEVLDGCGGTADGVMQCTEALQSRYRGWAQSASLPPADFQKQYDGEVASLAGNPVFRLLTPSVTRFRWAYAYYETRQALLRAALVVQAEGVEALEHHLDPHDGRPFSIPVSRADSASSRTSDRTTSRCQSVLDRRHLNKSPSDSPETPIRRQKRLNEGDGSS
jgi:hypothetical protein